MPRIAKLFKISNLSNSCRELRRVTRGLDGVTARIAQFEYGSNTGEEMETSKLNIRISHYL
jgi:hypothetical protein